MEGEATQARCMEDEASQKRCMEDEASQAQCLEDEAKLPLSVFHGSDTATAMSA
jgi:hypothetical protein